jgi:uncharacterized protein YbaR (Trm112 family)
MIRFLQPARGSCAEERSGIVDFETTLLEIVCCPVTQLPLAPMALSQVQRLNQLIGERRIKTRGGMLLDEPIEQALVTRDGKVAYPIRDGIPILLEESGIVLSQLEDSQGQP